MEVIKNNHGGDKLCLDGYSYTKKKVNKASIRWECSKRRTLNCKGCLTTDTAVTRVTDTSPHCHENDQVAIDAMKAREAIKDAVACNRGKTVQIVKDKLAEYPVEVRVAAGKTETIKRAVRRLKRGKTPDEPKKLSDIPEIPEEYTTTGGADNLPFLIYDNYSEGEPNDRRMLIFATDTGLKFMSESDEWFMDGTFGVAPRQFNQLFVIRTMKDDVAVTCVYAFLPTKDQSSYEEMLTAVLNKCQELGLVPDPLTISCDFEAAIHNSIRTMFGYSVNIQGCFYHLTQSTWRRVQQEGLTVPYKEDETIRHAVGMLDGLAFLPKDKVKEGLQHVRDIAPESVVDIVKYFDINYISGPFRATRGENRNLVMKRTHSPRFPVDVWNVHNATVNDRSRTNNVCESWNNSHSHLVGHHNPGLWHSIICLQKDQTSALTEIERHRVGDPSRKRVRRETVHLQKKLKMLCQQFDDGEKDIPEFMDTVGHYIRLC